MRFLDLVLPTTEENLALDEALLIQAEAGTGSEVLRLWELPWHSVVLGSGCSLDQDVREQQCRTDNIPIARRSSGGGTVLLGPGCLAYSLVLSYERAADLETVRGSYRYILGKVGKALENFSPGIDPAGISDLAIGGKKFSGSAQQRKRKHLLHHGTLLYAFDLDGIVRYLKEPMRRPAYRGDRDHAAFLMNLAVLQADLKTQIATAWSAHASVNDWPTEIVEQLLEQKYSRDDWLRRR